MTSCARSTSGSGKAWASATAPVGYVAELKIDGLSIALTYDNGLLTRGATRGDGERGEDVTGNVRDVRGIPQRLRQAPAGAFEVRGEIYLPRAEFDRVNQEREDGRRTGLCQPAQCRSRRRCVSSIRARSPNAS